MSFSGPGQEGAAASLHSLWAGLWELREPGLKPRFWPPSGELVADRCVYCQVSADSEQGLSGKRLEQGSE